MKKRNRKTIKELRQAVRDRRERNESYAKIFVDFLGTVAVYLSPVMTLMLVLSAWHAIDAPLWTMGILILLGGWAGLAPVLMLRVVRQSEEHQLEIVQILSRADIAPEDKARVASLLEQMEPSESGKYIYALHCPEDRTIKIGFSTRPKARVAKIKGGHAHNLYTAFILPGSVRRESELHRLLADYRLGGEWFEANDIVAGVVNNMAENTMWPGVK